MGGTPIDGIGERTADRHIQKNFGECAHVDLIGLVVPAEDIDIWNYALDNEYIIITKDNDFVDLLELNDFPPKVVLDLFDNHIKPLDSQSL